jgi:hypothetical protein
LHYARLTGPDRTIRKGEAMNRRFSTAASLLLLLCWPAFADEPAKAVADKPPAPSREELEKQFTAELTGATLVGHYTAGGTAADKEERYTISEVTKIKGDNWLFKTRVVYGQHDVTVPIPLEVRWAGDTPVITLTDMTIPSLGTYTARVLIYRGQYAGTWSGGNHGGQLFGRVEKKSEKDKADSEKPAESK